MELYTIVDQWIVQFVLQSILLLIDYMHISIYNIKEAGSIRVMLKSDGRMRSSCSEMWSGAVDNELQEDG